MKKFLALLLAMMMVLAAVSVLAEEAADSKENEDIAGVTLESGDVTVEKGEDTEAGKSLKEQVAAAQQEGDPTTALPEEVRAKLPEGFTVISEMDTYRLEGDPSELEDPVKMTFRFETPYGDGEKVMLIVAIQLPDNELDWLVWEGTGNADGDVESMVPRADLIQIGENPFVVIPVSQAK